MPPKYYTSKKKSSSSGSAGTGQFAAGALSKANTQTTTSSVVAPVQSRFVPLPSGKTGTLVDRTDPTITLSDKTPGAVLPQPVIPSQLPQPSPRGTDFFNYQDPGVLGPFGPQQTTRLPATQDAKGQQTSIFGAKVDQTATQVLNAGFNFVASLGNGDFARGMLSLITIPLTAGSTLISGSTTETGAFFVNAGKSGAGMVTTETLATGGVKVLNTVKNAIVKTFKPSKAVGSVQAMIAVGGLMWALSSIIKDSTGTGAIGNRDRLEEAGGLAGTTARDMIKNGDRQGYEESKILWDDLKNTRTSWTPFGVGAVKNANDFANAVDRNFEIWDAHLAREDAMAAEGITKQEDTARFWLEYHSRVNADKAAEEKASVDYYNEQRLLTEQQIMQLKLDMNAQNNASRMKQMRAEELFWLDYKKKIAELEQKQQEESAKFWLDYRKTVLKLQEESGRSRLGFGLFR